MLLGLEGVQIRVDLVSIDIEVELLSVMPEARKLALFLSCHITLGNEIFKQLLLCRLNFVL